MINQNISRKSQIGEGSLIDSMVTVGYPSKGKLIKNRDFLHSNGAIIGNGCILRSGTVIYEDVIIGNNVQTAHNVIIREGVKIGDGSVFGNGTVILTGATLGQNVRLMETVVISESAELGNNIFIGPHVSFTAGRYMTGAYEADGRMSHEEASQLEGVYWQGPSVIVEDDVRIGANAVILTGVHLGKGCVVAAGAVVSYNVPPGGLIAGNPGRILKDGNDA
ncbi:MAG TPA: N-acetyltransferase [Proteobacteria bacterium]|nr:N-acetyltransferase [Pseudomonadota bacterium]